MEYVEHIRYKENKKTDKKNKKNIVINEKKRRHPIHIATMPRFCNKLHQLRSKANDWKTK